MFEGNRIQTRKPLHLPPFETGVLLSLLLHVALWQGFALKRYFEKGSPDSSIEIDLTRPFRLTHDPSLARRAKVSGTGAPLVTSPKPVTAPAPAVPQTPPKDWVLPGPDTTELEKPSDGDEASPTGLGGLGDGTGTGEVDWVYLTTLPRMLNRDDLVKNLRRFYPESERLAGREGLVVIDVHIDSEGIVRTVDIIQTAGNLFDEAARKVIHEARFSPAKAGDKSVAVKIRQTIAFQLDN
ncbi:MAG: energy transducer TonB [Elusimicrobia bacterium]|nr:energy transducer TonB [Elusimicrobiota bacterium]